MSTTPQGWQTPKTNWQAADIVHPSDHIYMGVEVREMEQDDEQRDEDVF